MDIILSSVFLSLMNIRTSLFSLKEEKVKTITILALCSQFGVSFSFFFS